MFRWLLFAVLFGCGGEAETPTAACAWEEPLQGECARFAGPAQFSLEGRACEPVSCIVVPSGGNEGTIQQVEIDPPSSEAFTMEMGDCAALACQ